MAEVFFHLLRDGSAVSSYLPGDFLPHFVCPEKNFPLAGNKWLFFFLNFLFCCSVYESPHHRKCCSLTNLVRSTINNLPTNSLPSEFLVNDRKNELKISLNLNGRVFVVDAYNHQPIRRWINTNSLAMCLCMSFLLFKKKCQIKYPWMDKWRMMMKWTMHELITFIHLSDETSEWIHFHFRSLFDTTFRKTGKNIKWPQRKMSVLKNDPKIF